jgi:lysophospholipase L1-like esterase
MKKSRAANPPAAPKSPRPLTPVWKERTAQTLAKHLKELQDSKDSEHCLFGDSMFERWKTTGKNLWFQLGFSDLKLFNAGVGGDGTQHVLWRLNEGLFRNFKPKWVFLMIGTNNIERDSVEHIAEAIGLILQKIKADSPQTKVVLFGVLYRNMGHSLNAKIDQLNQLLSKLEDKERVWFVEWGNILGTAQNVRKELFDDTVHLNENGYRTWGILLVDIIRKFITNS